MPTLYYICKALGVGKTATCQRLVSSGRRRRLPHLPLPRIIITTFRTRSVLFSDAATVVSPRDNNNDNIIMHTIIMICARLWTVRSAAYTGPISWAVRVKRRRRRGRGVRGYDRRRLRVESCDHCHLQQRHVQQRILCILSRYYYCYIITELALMYIVCIGNANNSGSCTL